MSFAQICESSAVLFPELRARVELEKASHHEAMKILAQKRSQVARTELVYRMLSVRHARNRAAPLRPPVELLGRRLRRPGFKCLKQPKQQLR